MRSSLAADLDRVLRQSDLNPLHERRVKRWLPSVHELTGSETRSLRALRREDQASRYVFMTERGAPMSPAGFR